MKGRNFRIYYPLLPFAWIYRAIVSVRNLMFDKGILQSRRFDIPVISIGNISVGGTGKTPHTEYLIRLLQNEFQLAILSRGYKRKSKGFVLATPDTPTEMIGDEPFQMAHKYPQIYMAVDRDRCHGIERLTDGHTAPGVKAIVLDDAYQHRYVKPGLNILLTDYNRLITRDKMLPAGRLREPTKGKDRADIIVVSKCPTDISKEERKQITAELAPSHTQQLYFSTFTYGRIQPLFTEGAERELSDIRADEHIVLVTGIASPQPLIERLKQQTAHITPLTFADHHDFTAADMSRIADTFLGLRSEKELIVTTEKDAARLAGHPLMDERIKPFIYVVPVMVKFIEKEELFNLNIINYVRNEYVRQDSRNSSLLKG